MADKCPECGSPHICEVVCDECDGFGNLDADCEECDGAGVIAGVLECISCGYQGDEEEFEGEE